MDKELVPIMYCQENQVLADNVFDDEGVLIAIKNTILTDYVIEKIKLFNVDNVWIYDGVEIIDEEDSYEASVDSFTGEYLRDTLLVKKAIMGLSKGEKLDMEIIKNISYSLYQETMDSYASVRYISRLKDYNEYTYYHSVNVAVYTILIGRWMGFSERYIKELTTAAVLHDIGKSRIPNEILNKDEKLTKEECEIVKEHPMKGYLMVKDDDSISENIKNTILMHHERLDGSGYPQGLKDNEINYFAKIIAVADYYDALTSNRPYRDKVSPFQAIETFIKTGMESYDLGISMTFFKNIVNCYIGEKARLDDGRIGKVLYVPPYDLVHPLIEIDGEIYDLSRHNEIEIVSLI